MRLPSPKKVANVCVGLIVIAMLAWVGSKIDFASMAHDLQTKAIETSQS